MSSAPDSLKKSSEEPAVDEPSSKKAKIADTDASATDNRSNVENGDYSKSNRSSNNNNNNKIIPSKAINGNNKESSKPGDNEDECDDSSESGNVEEVFDPKVANCLEQVENIQQEICNLNETASEEILKVEQKFNKLRRPHFEKRNELLMEIPNFWLTAMANHPTIASMIESAEDEDCLHYLINLDVEEFEDIKSGYKLKLHFSENPYISNEVIVKEFQIVSSEEVVSGVSPILYKDTPKGKKLQQIVEDSIAEFRRSRRPGQTHQSFFAWLAECSESGSDEVAEILKDQIWPNPLEFFFATHEEYGAGTDDESDEDEEIDDEDIDDDDDDGADITGIEGEYSEEELEGEEDVEELEDDDLE